jgi:hypothetical protein
MNVASTKTLDLEKADHDFPQQRAAELRVFVATKEHAASHSAGIAAMYEEALGKGGVQKDGCDPYPDLDLFCAEGVRKILEEGERTIALAELREHGRPVVVGAMVADMLGPNQVEFNSLAVPISRRGNGIGSAIVRGLLRVFDQSLFTVNCTEIVTHSLASQTAHFHSGFEAICGFGFCHYPHVFFANHPESVLWATVLQGSLVPVLKKIRQKEGKNLGQNAAEVKSRLSRKLNNKYLPDEGQGKRESDSLALACEVLSSRPVFVPARYDRLVRAILKQFEDILDRPLAPAAEAEPRAEEKISGASILPANLNVEYKDGFDHSYIIWRNGFQYDGRELDQALASIHLQGKRYMKACLPTHSSQSVAAANHLIADGFVFHSYLPLYGTCEGKSGVELYDMLCLQWIAPEVVRKNALPGETDSVIKLYGYPENLSGEIVKLIGGELRALSQTRR